MNYILELAGQFHHAAYLLKCNKRKNVINMYVIIKTENRQCLKNNYVQIFPLN